MSPCGLNTDMETSASLGNATADKDLFHSSRVKVINNKTAIVRTLTAAICGK